MACGCGSADRTMSHDKNTEATTTKDTDTKAVIKRELSRMSRNANNTKAVTAAMVKRRGANNPVIACACKGGQHRYTH